MLLRWSLAALHLLALGIGFGALWGRAAALRGPVDAANLRRLFAVDTWWGLAAFLWLATGLARLFMGTEKATTYYMQNHVFGLKMTLFLAIFLLELKPMVTLIKWRKQVARGEPVDPSAAPTLAKISYVQAGLLILMVLAATAMARGIS